MQYRVVVLSLLILFSPLAIAADKPSYKGLMRIPVPLYTGAGRHARDRSI